MPPSWHLQRLFQALVLEVGVEEALTSQYLTEKASGVPAFPFQWCHCLARGNFAGEGLVDAGDG